MPNWCWNNLIITPSESDTAGEGIKNLRAKLLFMVDDIKENPKLWAGTFDYLVGREADWDEIEGWYEHNIRVYGSKWQLTPDDFMESLEDDGECITMGFQTAWSPVTKFSRLLSEKYQLHIEHTFDETGDWFAGKMVADNGEVLEDIFEDYYYGMYLIDKDLFWHEIYNNMECWLEDDLEEAEESFQSAYKEVRVFLSPEELLEFKNKFKSDLKEAKKKEKILEKSGLNRWRTYLVDGIKLEFADWSEKKFRFYKRDENKNIEVVEFTKLPKNIVEETK